MFIIDRRAAQLFANNTQPRPQSRTTTRQDFNWIRQTQSRRIRRSKAVIDSCPRILLLVKEPGHLAARITRNNGFGVDDSSVQPVVQTYSSIAPVIPSLQNIVSRYQQLYYQPIDSKSMRHGSYRAPLSSYLHLYPPHPVQPGRKCKPIYPINSWMPQESVTNDTQAISNLTSIR